jgi:anti-anti-sigma factor
MGRELKINRRASGSTMILDLEGEISLKDSKELKDTLNSIIETGEYNRIVLNLEQVPFVNSIGLGILMEMNRDVPGRGIRLSLMNAGHNLEGIFDVTQVKQFFDFVKEDELDQ